VNREKVLQKKGASDPAGLVASDEAKLREKCDGIIEGKKKKKVACEKREGKGSLSLDRTFWTKKKKKEVDGKI